MKKLFFIIIFATIFVSVFAQKNDTLVRNIQIERDYTPEVAKAERLDVSLTNVEPQTEKNDVKFSEFSVPFEIEKGEFIPIAPQNTTALNREKSKSGFLRVGVGALFTWLADLWYPVWNDKNGYFDIAVHHNAILGVVNPTKKLLNTGLGINFNKNFGVHQFYLGAKYDNEFFNYYGRDITLANWQYWDTLNTANQSFNKTDFMLGVRSNKRTDSGWFYDAYLNYHLFATGKNVKIAEHNINVAVRADVLLGEQSSIDTEFGLQTYFYSPKDSVRYADLPYRFEQNWKANAIIRLFPAYILKTKTINLRLGVKSWLNFGKENDGMLGDVFAAAPDVKLDYFFKDFLNLYVGVTGDYKINSLANIAEKNRYYIIENATEHHTYTPLDIFGGFKVKITKGLLLDAFIGYKPFIKDALFFINPNITLRSSPDLIENVFMKQFWYQESYASLFSAGVRVNYDIKERVNVFAQMKYNGWSLDNYEYAWHSPAFEFNAGSEFKIGKGFFGSVNFYCASKTIAAKQYEGNTGANEELLTLPAMFDLNLGFGYNIKKNISLFAQVNNILALSPKLNYQRWYGYNSFGANVIVGATILF